MPRSAICGRQEPVAVIDIHAVLPYLNYSRRAASLSRIASSKDDSLTVSH